MPWKTSDVGKFKKGLTDKQKEKWVAIANSTLKVCLKNDGEKLECEASAIKIANSKFSTDTTLNETRYLKDQIEENHDTRFETRMRLTLSEVDESDDYQMILPVGVFQSDWYGEIIITNSYNEAMVDNWRNKVMGNRQPFIDTLHDRGKANGWIEDMEARDNGLYAKINWTRMGKENIEEKYLKYFSADLGSVTHIDSGKTVWPVLFAVALCNTPVMNTMQEAQLSRPATKPAINSAHRDGDKNKKGVSTMTLEEILEGIKELELSDEDKKKLVETAGISIAEPEEKEEEAEKPNTEKLELSERVANLEEQIEVLKSVNKDLSKTITDARQTTLARTKEEVIGKALSEGRITPKDKETWEKRFDKNPDAIAEILAGLPEVVDLSERGDGAGGGETVQLSKNEKQVNTAFGITDDDVKEHGGDK